MRNKRQFFSPLVTILLMAAIPFYNGCGVRESDYNNSGAERKIPGLRGSVDYPPGFAFVEVPDPLSGENPPYPEPTMPVPEVGVTFEDDTYSYTWEDKTITVKGDAADWLFGDYGPDYG